MSVTIVWGPVRSGFSAPLTPSLFKAIDEKLSPFVPGYRYSKQFKAKVVVKDRNGNPVIGPDGKPKKRRIWDGKKHFLYPKIQTFPTGLLDHVTAALEEEGEEVICHQTTDVGDILPLEDLPDGSKLRDYQVASCEAFLAKPRGILRLPTASGKTLVAAAITRSMNRPTLGLIHGNTLLDQTHSDFERHLEREIGLIGNQSFNLQDITLASVDTIYSRLKGGDRSVVDFLDQVEFIWCDEVHRASAMSWVEILQIVETPYRLGLSGTPFKKQELRDMELQAWTGPLLYNVEPQQLQEAGYLSPAHLTAIEVFSPVNEIKDYREVVQKLIIEHEDRNTVLADIAIERAKAGKSVFVLAGNSLDLAHWFYRYIEDEFRGVELVTGKTGVWANREALKRFSEGASRIIVSTVVMDEGINAPNTNVVILAHTGKSYVKVIQRIGRGLRLKPDGTELEVVDVLDYTNFYLRNHARKRLSYYEDEGFFSRVDVVKGVR